MTGVDPSPHDNRFLEELMLDTLASEREALRRFTSEPQPIGTASELSDTGHRSEFLNDFAGERESLPSPSPAGPLPTARGEQGR